MASCVAQVLQWREESGVAGLGEIFPKNFSFPFISYFSYMKIRIYYRPICKVPVRLSRCLGDRKKNCASPV